MTTITDQSGRDSGSAGVNASLPPTLQAGDGGIRRQCRIGLRDHDRSVNSLPSSGITGTRATVHKLTVTAAPHWSRHTGSVIRSSGGPPLIVAHLRGLLLGG